MIVDLDKTDKFPRLFWGSMWMYNPCHECGWTLNGHTKKWELLNAPSMCSCSRCGAEWSTALDEAGRLKMKSRLADEARFYALRDELAEVVARLNKW